MITEEKLLKRDFDKVHGEPNLYIRGAHTISLTDGVVDYIRESDAHEGLSIEINEINQLDIFFKYLSRQ